MAQHITFQEIQRKAKAVLQSRQDFRAAITQDGHPPKMLGRLAPISSPTNDNEKSNDSLQQLKEGGHHVGQEGGEQLERVGTMAHSLDDVTAA